MQGAHDFAEKYNCVPKAFYHDQQTEFAKSMRECVKIFARISRKAPEITRPWMPGDITRKDYDLGNFSLPSSKDFMPLQAVDVLLWIMQRENEPALQALRDRILERADTFYISRGISELIRFAGFKKLFGREFSEDELLKGKELQDRMEADFQRDLRDFSRKRVANATGGAHVTGG